MCFLEFVFVCIVLTHVVFAGTGPEVAISNDGEILNDSIFRLNCHVRSNSTPTIKWYKNSKLIKCKPNDCKVSTSQNEQYYWSNITSGYPKVNDTYTCVANSTDGISSDSYVIPCFEGTCLEWEDSLQGRNVNINVGESFSINCELMTMDKYASQCYKFGILHFNHSYSVKPVVTHKGYKHFISYAHNITGASKNNSGSYLCFYEYDFTVTKPKHCPGPWVKSFNIHVTEPNARDHDDKGHIVMVLSVVSFISIVGGLILLVSIIYLRKHKLKSKRLYESEPELRWDVFVSYSSKDFDWVKELCKTLEEAPFNLIVCLHQRDWEVGRTILDNMAESIYCSQKTLLIVSKSYLESSFCMQELNIAMDRQSQKALKDRVIVIKLDDVSLKSLPKILRHKSFLDFSNDEQRKHYKTKLLKALPRRELEVECDGSDGDHDGGDPECFGDKEVLEGHWDETIDTLSLHGGIPVNHSGPLSV
ncbi:uncharacterized protein LOC114528769 isoform X2 [Dendronephthya gigantea]|uniref:uncharacterized protein LOC114528769 isoform X2 n=1 Tax=Dendronephthya gigantea TaxID=151771 RepID=UPI00106D875D|nr:uncharacterized protein LOC114528769 isoform X2 [Dendronephthya gigantea]